MFLMANCKRESTQYLGKGTFWLSYPLIDHPMFTLTHFVTLEIIVYDLQILKCHITIWWWVGHGDWDGINQEGGREE